MSKYLFLVFILLFACGPVKNLNTIKDAISNDVDADGVTDQQDTEPNNVEPDDNHLYMNRMTMTPSPQPIKQTTVTSNGRGVKSLPKANIVVDNTSNEPTIAPNIGLIAYTVPNEMQVGKDFSVKVRVSKEKIKEDLIKNNNANTNSTITIENIRVSSIMSADLRSSKDNYLIESLSTETQNIEDLGYTEWEWHVKPLKKGEKPLKLIIKVRIETNNEQTFKDIVVFEKNITVKNNFFYSLNNFMSKYWQWFITTFILPFAIWYYNKKRKKKSDEVPNNNQ